MALNGPPPPPPPPLPPFSRYHLDPSTMQHAPSTRATTREPTREATRGVVRMSTATGMEVQGTVRGMNELEMLLAQGRQQVKASGGRFSASKALHGGGGGLFNHSTVTTSVGVGTAGPEGEGDDGGLSSQRRAAESLESSLASPLLDDVDGLPLLSVGALPVGAPKEQGVGIGSRFGEWEGGAGGEG